MKPKYRIKIESNARTNEIRYVLQKRVYFFGFATNMWNNITNILGIPMIFESKTDANRVLNQKLDKEAWK